MTAHIRTDHSVPLAPIGLDQKPKNCAIRPVDSQRRDP